MPSSRLRVYQYLPFLRQFSIEPAVLPAVPEPWFSRFYYSSSKGTRLIHYSGEILGSVARLIRGRQYDIIFVQKGILSTNWKGFDDLLGWANKRLVFDLDDWVYGKSVVEFRSPLLRAFQDKNQTEKISSRSKAVVVGNAYLKKLALQYNSNVSIIPTPVDTGRFMPGKTKSVRKGDEVVIGWMGVAGGLEYVRLLEKVFRDLSKRYSIRLKLITRLGNESFRWDAVPIDYREWSYQSEVREMEECDIGIMPLRDDEWSRGKCSLKLLQYMAMGLPSVSSRIGNNAEVIEDGVDGFLAQEPEEWFEKLSRLIEDQILRKNMGEKARAKVVDRYSLEKTTPLLAKVLKDVYGA